MSVKTLSALFPLHTFSSVANFVILMSGNVCLELHSVER